jgi:hypothetical protein
MLINVRRRVTKLSARVSALTCSEAPSGWAPPMIAQSETGKSEARMYDNGVCTCVHVLGFNFVLITDRRYASPYCVLHLQVDLGLSLPRLCAKRTFSGA